MVLYEIITGAQLAINLILETGKLIEIPMPSDIVWE